VLCVPLEDLLACAQIELAKLSTTENLQQKVEARVFLQLYNCTA